MDQSVRNVALLVIGNEVLCGDVEEINSLFLAREITRLGSRVGRILTLPDEEKTISTELIRLARDYDAVIVTGGIGVTHDDVTRQAVAGAFSLPLAVNRDALATLEAHFGERMTPWRMKLAELPEPCRLIPNPVGFAPGFIVENVYVFPGVPDMLKAMFPFVEADFAGPPLHHETVYTDLPESVFAGPLGRIAEDYPLVDIGSYPQSKDENRRVRLVIKSRDPGELSAVLEVVRGLIKKLEGDG